MSRPEGEAVQLRREVGQCNEGKKANLTVLQYVGLSFLDGLWTADFTANTQMVTRHAREGGRI